NGCDRACLNGFVDKFLAALQAHDPSKLPHSANLRYSENNVMLKLGDGLWATADGVGAYKIYIDDPTTGEVGYYGVIDENHTPDILGARLKVVNRQVTEIEVLVARPQSAKGPFAAEGLKEKPIFNEDVPPGERLPRAKMIALANGYFDTIQKNTGKIYTSFAPDCQRVENGMITANNPNAQGVPHMGCEAQLKTGLLRFVTRCRDRRFVVVDQQKGLVLMNGFFDHAGTDDTFKLVDGTTYQVKPPFDRPFSFVMFELFKIDRAQLRQIEAVIVTVPYHMPTPWK
ncbi:MAG: hypothetical protein KGL75_00410, partial [Acidobacteriota bacterium]|nr:hypothetical protein [Acidobacteriota bacterium]